MQEPFSQTSKGQLIPYTIEATIQQTTDDLLQHLAKSHTLTWVSHQKSSPEENELPLWTFIIKDDIYVLVTQFQQQMYDGFNKMMKEMSELYNKQQQ